MPTSYILFGQRRNKLWDTRKRDHLILSKSDWLYHIKQQSVDFSAYTAYIWNVKKHNITMRDTESVLIKRNPNK